MNNPELLDFSEQTRRAAGRIMTALVAGDKDGAFEIASELCTNAAGIKARLQMQAELASPERYSLSALSVDPSAPTNSELPYD